jgi:hypothetical protein
MCGKTTMSRSGSTGYEWLSPRTMVGRVFGVVMAYSFCFAPLLAVRPSRRNCHKVPYVPGHFGCFAAAFAGGFCDESRK